MLSPWCLCPGSKEEANKHANLATNGTEVESLKGHHSPAPNMEDNSSDVDMESSSNSTNGLTSSASNGMPSSRFSF